MVTTSESANVLWVGRGLKKTAVLIPVKPFELAKRRLAPAYDPATRAALARDLLHNVITAAQGLRVAIVAPAGANDVRRVALINGARFLAEPDGAGLNGAVQSGVRQLAERAYTRVIVIHSDLPYVRDVTWLEDTDDMIIVPDHTGTGTNAISLPSDSGFQFSYGANSLERHIDEGRRLGFDPKVIIDLDGVSADIDEPSDAVDLGLPIRR